MPYPGVAKALIMIALKLIVNTHERFRTPFSVYFRTRYGGAAFFRGHHWTETELTLTRGLTRRCLVSWPRST